MNAKSFEDLLDLFGENISAEATSQGLETWSIGASGENVADAFQGYSLDDLEELREEILDGQKVQVVVDLSDSFLAFLEEMIENNQEEDDGEDEELDDYEDEDYDEEDDY